MNAATLRLLLLIFLFALYTIAIVYLSRRPLPAIKFTLWALFALFVPLLGPFIVILARPGGNPLHSETVHTRNRR